MATLTEQCSISSIEELFVFERTPDDNLKTIIFYIYSPIGLLLLIFRILYGFHTFVVACVLRKTTLLRRVVVRVMCALLGIIVVQDGHRDSKCRLIIANHVSTLDHMAIDLVQPCILPSVWDIPNLLRWCLGYADLGARQGRQVLIDNARLFCKDSNQPLLALPEGAMTSGRRGMLKFSSWPFDVCQTVQPVIVSLRRPYIADIAACVFGGSWWQDTLWFLFVPYTVFRLRWLSPMKRQETESCEDFCRRVSDAMGNEAQLEVTGYTCQEAVEAAKRHLKEIDRRQRTAAIMSKKPSRPVTSSELDSMALRVKQTFPGIPLLLIRKDLDETKSVDLTSNNILEGLLPQKVSLPNISTKSSNFDVGSWQALYKHRKWTLIEENRQKYIERKHLRL